MKGFFSHGITMIVKEAVHKLVIHLYYSILKMLKKYPSPKELAGSVTGQVGQVVDNAGDLAKSAKEQSGQITENIRQSTGSTKEQAGRTAESVEERVKQAAVSAKTQAGQMTDDLGDWTQGAAANVAGGLGERKQQAAKLAKDGIQVVKEKGQELTTEANDRLKKADDT